MKGNKALYDKTKVGYYHEAMLKGKPVQRFWHRAKFATASEMIDQNKEILDAACGPGSLFYIMKKPMKKYIGMDLAESQVKYAKKIFPKASYVVGDIYKIPFKEKSFDYIVMLELIEHLPENEEVFKQTRKLLKSDGKLIISTPNYRSLWPILEKIWNLVSPIDYEEQHINRYNIDRLVSELKYAGYKKIKVKTRLFISPFFAIISTTLALQIFKIEKYIFPRLGALIFIEAEN